MEEALRINRPNFGTRICPPLTNPRLKEVLVHAVHPHQREGATPQVGHCPRGVLHSAHLRPSGRDRNPSIESGERVRTQTRQ